MHRIITSFMLAACIAIPSGPVVSQIYSASECTKAGNPELASKIRSGKIEKLSWMGRWHLGDYACDWTTSYLPATGRRPQSPPNLESLPGWELKASEYQESLERWSCMYSPWSAMDGDPKTAWCEGKKDDGIGEFLLVKVDVMRPVKIWAGLGASPGLHKMNGRPKKVRVYVLQAAKAYMDITQYGSGIGYRDISVLGSADVTLKDENGYQVLPLPKFRLRNKIGTVEGQMPEPLEVKDSTLVAIEILSVYPGTKYRDTCISEIGN